MGFEIPHQFSKAKGNRIIFEGMFFWNNLTWVFPKQVAQQGGVGPVEHILNAHAVRDVFAEALSDVLGQKESVGVPLTICHQKQHPHKARIC